MPSQLSTRCALALLCATLLASVAGLLALGPLPDGIAVAWTGLATAQSPAWAVALQLPLLAVALAGWRQVAQDGTPTDLKRAWGLAWLLVGLAACGGIAQALGLIGALPARAPGASAAALLALIFLAERLHPAWAGRSACLLAAVAGPLAAAVAGFGLADMRGLLWLEHLPLLMLPLGVWSLRSRGLGGGDWLLALLVFAAARLLAWADVSFGPGAALSSAALQPLLLAASVGVLVWALARQGAAAGAVLAGASQRSTSLNTAG
jgi:hypothetical protein